MDMNSTTAFCELCFKMFFPSRQNAVQEQEQERRRKNEERRTKTEERSQSVRQEVGSPNLACMQGCVGGGIWFLREACFRKLVPEIAPVQLLFFQPLPQPPALRNATCSACTIQATSCDQCEADMSPVP